MAGTEFGIESLQAELVELKRVNQELLAKEQLLTERLRVEEVQTFLAQTSSDPTGEPFFMVLVRFLAQILKMDFVYIDRLDGDGAIARTVAVWNDDHLGDNFSYALKETPCGELVGQAVCCFPSGVCQKFPRDQVLKDLKAESYAGVTLWSHTGHPIGLIAVIGRTPLIDRSLAELTLKLVAVRAAGELERMKSEEALRESNELFALFMQYSPVYTYIKEVTPEESRVIQASDNFRFMIGRTGSDMLGKTMAELFPPEFAAKITADDWAVVSAGKVLSVDEILDGRHYTTIKFPIRRQGKYILAGYTIDITERVKAEERERELQAKLERVSRMEALGVLAGGVAHDLNNVLGPIVALPDLVIEYLERHGNPADQEYLDTLESAQMMRASALRAAGVVSDLVVLGRRGRFQKDVLDINRVVSQVLESKQIRALREHAPGISVSMCLADESLCCEGSESRLGRVLSNLVSNAVEAIEGQGEVTVRTGRRVLLAPYSGYEMIPAGNYVTMEVADTGCGIDIKHISRIFEPFFSTKTPSERSGSGLGLSVVHGLVRDHAGYLDAKSIAGQGATFTVYLNAVESGSQLQLDHDQEILSGGSERILIVDDEPGQRLVARQHLRKLGYDVAEVDSGEKALALFQVARGAAQPAPFDLVLTDMRLKGFDGGTTCKLIRELYASQKMLIMSGCTPGGAGDSGQAVSVDWLSKPFTAVDLTNAVRRRLDRD